MTDQYPTDPTTLRAEARDISIGAPDEGWLRACADRIEDQETEIKRLRDVLRRITGNGHEIIYNRDGHEEAVLIAREALKCGCPLHGVKEDERTNPLDQD